MDSIGPLRVRVHRSATSPRALDEHPVPVLLTILVTVVGCGRVGFAPGSSVDAGELASDVAGDASSLCDSAAPFGAPMLVSGLMSDINEGSLRLMPDELSGYIWRGGPGAGDVLLVTRADLTSAFTVSPVTGLDLSSELDPTLPDSGAFIVFRVNNPGDDLYVASRSAPDLFSPPASLSRLNTASVEAQPFIPIGRDELYYQSRTTGNGEIYRTVLSQISSVDPVRIGDLSSPDEEGDPVVTPDGLTIYFRSNRPAALASFNIYVATRATVNDPFGPATLVDNVNTNAEDGPSWISPDGCRLYLTSNVSGNFDIYVATRGFPI